MRTWTPHRRSTLGERTPPRTPRLRSELGERMPLRAHHRRLPLGLLVLLSVTGCGSAAATELPPGAEPGRAPPLSQPPAGRVFAVGGRPQALVVDPVSGLLRVTTHAPDRVVALDPHTGRVVRRTPAPDATAPTSDPDPDPGFGLSDPEIIGAGDTLTAGGRTYVADARRSTLSLFGAGGRRAARTRTALEPADIELASRGRLVAVLARRERVLELYDARTLERRGRADAGVGPTHVVSDGRDRLYVIDTGGNALLVYQLRPRFELTRRVYLADAPYGVAIDSAGGRIWVAMTDANVLSELAGGGRPRMLRSHPSVRQASAVAVDPVTGRVFVAGAADGVVQVLDPPPLRRERTR